MQSTSIFQTRRPPSTIHPSQLAKEAISWFAPVLSDDPILTRPVPANETQLARKYDLR